MVGGFGCPPVFQPVEDVKPPDFESWRVSAYIPCFNNAKTIALAIQGIRDQTRPVDELFVVDDGSTDNSTEIAEGLGVRVIRLGQNLGRGPARATAMEAAEHEFVLCGDATNRLSPTFLQEGLKWFADEHVLAVCGRCYDRNQRTTIDRWRARHLYKQHIPVPLSHRGALSTYGAIVRKSAVMQAGNYDRRLRHGEDYALGGHLLAKGNVVADPTLEIQPVIQNTLFQVMERFARWNRTRVDVFDLREIIRSHVVAWRILIPRDLEQGDWRSACISATVPYFCFAYADKKSLLFSRKATMERS
jgi:glycosyltransferase involved in cell wall biosynthesis